MANILVVGSMNMDLTIETERIPKIGETITGKGFKTLPGGKGLNQAIACARLGGNVKFLGAVGDDAYGSQLIETLQSENIVYDEALTFTSSFTTGENDWDGFSKNETYENWNWYLARANGGQWHLVSWGVC